MMLRLLLTAALCAGSASALGVGCDAICAHKGLVLSCRVRITWAMVHTTYRDDPASACSLARAHVLDLCPSCADCSREGLGDACNGSVEDVAAALRMSSGADAPEHNASEHNAANASSAAPNATAAAAASGGAKAAASAMQPGVVALTNGTGRSAAANGTAASNATTTNATNATNASSAKKAKKKPARTSVTTSTSTTTTSETFCCSAAVDDDDFCGTCWESAPIMDETYCRKSKDTCEECGHVWCNRSKFVKASCKLYGCIDFTPFNECQCNPECERFGSCCDDYQDTCVKDEKDDEAEAPTALSEKHAVPRTVSGGLMEAGVRLNTVPAALAASSGLLLLVAAAVARRGLRMSHRSVVRPEAELYTAPEGDAGVALVE